jgi:hypothetical protein
MDEQHQIQASTAISDADIAEELRSLESLVCPEILQWLLAPPVQLEQLESLAPAVDVDAVIERALQRVDSSTSGVVASKIAQSQLHPLLDSQPRLLPERANQPHPSSSRFGAPITTEDLFSVIDKRVPENTKRTTSWGYKVWNEWCEARNIQDKIVDMEASMMNELRTSTICSRSQEKRWEGDSCLFTQHCICCSTTSERKRTARDLVF